MRESRYPHRGAYRPCNRGAHDHVRSTAGSRGDLDAPGEAADVDIDLAYVDDLPATIARYDRMIVYSPRFDPALLAAAERLKIIACHACPPEVLSAATAQGIRVTLTPSLWDTVADVALLYYGAARKPALEAEIGIAYRTGAQGSLPPARASHGSPRRGTLPFAPSRSRVAPHTLTRMR